MKQSYFRSKVTLQPLNTSHFKSKKSVLDYQQYEDQLSSYQKNKKPDISDLFDWTKPNELVSFRKPTQSAEQPEVIQNNSMNTEELLRSDVDERDRSLANQMQFQDSIQIQSPKNSPKPSFTEQIRKDYGNEYKIMSQIKLESQLKQMRERLIDMNTKLNMMLDRYELLSGATNKKEAQINNPYKFLSKQIELNSYLIQKQLTHIKQLQNKDKELQKKDYLLELSELIVQIKKQIHDEQKEKHDQSVDVEKINKLIKQIEQVQEDGEEFKAIKELKPQIVFYFKKFKEQNTIEQQLQKDIEALTEKHSNISSKLYQLTKVAAEKYLQVSANKPYLQIKKRYDQLVVNYQSQRKKRQIIYKTVRTNTEKLNKENQQLKKDIQKCELQTQQLEYEAQQFDQESAQLIKKNNVLNKQMKSISYRFDSSLVHSNKLKPDFKRVLSRMEGSKVNKTIDFTNREVEKKRFSINDKNLAPQEISESIENAESFSALSKMKPILRSWKGKNEYPRYLPSPQKYKSIESSSIFKPPPLIKSKK